MEIIMPFIWAGVIIGSVITEASTVALVAIWFMPAAIISMILSLCSAPIWLQMLVFVVLSIAFIIFSCIVIRKRFFNKRVATNADMVIGEKAVVVEPIDSLACTGQVKVKGQIWTARPHDKNKKYDIGEILDVVAIEGVKLICEK